MVKHTGTTNKRAAKRLFHRFLDKLPELDDDPDEETSDIEVEPPKLLAKISVDTKPGPKKRKHNPKDDDEDLGGSGAADTVGSGGPNHGIEA